MHLCLIPTLIGLTELVSSETVHLYDKTVLHHLCFCSPDTCLQAIVFDIALRVHSQRCCFVLVTYDHAQLALLTGVLLYIDGPGVC